MTTTELRILLMILGVIILASIYWFGRPRARAQAALARAGSERREPVIGDETDESGTPHFSALDQTPWHQASGPQIEALHVDGLDEREDVRSSVGQRGGIREGAPHERIVTLYVVAQDGYVLQGPELLVAGEKAGLVHGDLGIFHRLVDAKPELGPVFSMANMVRPGVFDLARMDQFTTPGVVLFMTLPGPLCALDAWDMMLPAATRFSELLGAQLLDDQRSPLGRQRIAALRDDLRAFDRKREQQQIKPGW